MLGELHHLELGGYFLSLAFITRYFVLLVSKIDLVFNPIMCHKPYETVFGSSSHCLNEAGPVCAVSLKR